ncbi:MAG: hypothetical protein M0029_12015 [Actinomycetota bacterium]|jgi:hypothetical protein|nr:hypothetical protein [Actinomycetota bacterium]
MATDHSDDQIASVLGAVATGVERAAVPPDVRVIAQRARRLQRDRRHRRISVAASVVVIAGAITAAVVVPGHGRSPAPRHIAAVPSHVVRFGDIQLVVKDLPVVARRASSIPPSNVTSLHLPLASADHASIAFGAGNVWVLEHTATGVSAPCGRVAAVGAASAQVVASVPIDLCPDALAYGAGSVWVLSSQIGVTGFQLDQVDPSTFTVRSTVTIDGGPGGLTPQGDTGVKYQFVTVGGGQVVVAVQEPSGAAQLTALDAATATVTRLVTLPRLDGPVTGLGTAGGTMWVGTANGWVISFDPRSGALSRGVRLGTRVASLTAAGSELWVTVNVPVPPHATYPGLDTLRLDPTTGKIAQDTGLPMAFVSTDGTSVWALGSAPPYGSDAGLLAKIAATVGTMSDKAQLPATGYIVPDTLGVYADTAWVINDRAGTLARISP